MSHQLEADYAISLHPSDIADLKNVWWWSGWKRHHWPAYVVRPGVLLYAFDTDKRHLVALLRITSGGSFHYTSKADFRKQVKQLTGKPPNTETLNDKRHWEALPTGSSKHPCIGIAIRWEVLKKRMDVFLSGKFPRLGWKKVGQDKALAVFELDASDLYLEGNRVLRTHLEVERNVQLRADAKMYWRKKQGGHLRCSLCNFDFAKSYGEEWIEMHHVNPISQTGKKRNTVKALRPVCANCHRMIHRNPWQTRNMGEMRALIRKCRRKQNQTSRQSVNRLS